MIEDEIAQLRCGLLWDWYTANVKNFTYMAGILMPTQMGQLGPPTNIRNRAFLSQSSAITPEILLCFIPDGLFF
jgi:hypothetical protein